MTRNLYHPETPLKRKLTEQQEELLLKIVMTNGGGINRDNSGYADSVISGLVRRHLIQGKSGRSWMMVHTRDSLEMARLMRQATKETVG